MNIFYLDRHPIKAAQMMCDKHVVKMILESAQMLSTAHRVLDGDEYADKVGLYKMAHKNHPFSYLRNTLFFHHPKELLRHDHCIHQNRDNLITQSTGPPFWCGSQR